MSGNVHNGWIKAGSAVVIGRSRIILSFLLSFLPYGLRGDVGQVGHLSCCCIRYRLSCPGTITTGRPDDFSCHVRQVPPFEPRVLPFFLSRVRQRAIQVSQLKSACVLSSCLKTFMTGGVLAPQLSCPAGPSLSHLPVLSIDHPMSNCSYRLFVYRLFIYATPSYRPSDQCKFLDLILTAL